MASSFEKSVKGATKIKVSLLAGKTVGINLLLHLANLRSQQAAPPKSKYDFPCTWLFEIQLTQPAFQVYRTHSHSDAFWRKWSGRSVPSITEPVTRLDVDSGLQELDHSTFDDQRGFAGCYVGISGTA